MAERADFARGLAVLGALMARMVPASAHPAALAVEDGPGPSPAVTGQAGNITDAARSGPVRARLDRCLARINAHERRLSAFTLVMADVARADAARLDALPPEARGPLHGMVISVKDIIDVAGVATTAASASRLSRVPAGDAPLVARLRAAGAVIVGKANCHEYAFGGPAFDLPFPPARNPWDDSLFPGGSSSGSGVGVAAGFCEASIGTDTAGSIRLPSSHCGVVGLKLSHRPELLQGVLALAPSLDSVGPLARSVADCAAIFRVLVPDAADTPAPGLAVPDAAWLDGLGCEAASRAAFLRACDACRAAGMAPEVVALPPLPAFHAAGSVAMMAEVAATHAAAVRADFTRYGEVFRNRALLGEAVPASAHAHALVQCAALAGQVARALAGRALLLPGAPIGPVPLAAVDKFYFLRSPNLNIIANCIGAPALSLPVLRDGARRPFGIQLLGGAGTEAGLLALGARLEGLLVCPPEAPF